MDTLRHSKINLCLQANGKRHQGSSARAKQAEGERKEGPQGSKERYAVAREKERMRSSWGEGRGGRRDRKEAKKDTMSHGRKPGERIVM